MVTNELRGERVDVVPLLDDPVELIQNALAPARVRDVVLDDATGTATVVVSDYQLSLAIGKEGQNARLAARLTGWRIDIKSETQLLEEEAAGYGGQEWAEGEWVENASGEMEWKPAEGGEKPSRPRSGPTQAEEQSEGTDGASAATGRELTPPPRRPLRPPSSRPGAGASPLARGRRSRASRSDRRRSS